MTVRDLNKSRKIYRPFKRDPKLDPGTTTTVTQTSIVVSTATGTRIINFVVPFAQDDFPAFQTSTTIAL